MQGDIPLDNYVTMMQKAKDIVGYEKLEVNKLTSRVLSGQHYFKKNGEWHHM